MTKAQIFREQLSKFPWVNGNGQELESCNKCKGSGRCFQYEEQNKHGVATGVWKLITRATMYAKKRKGFKTEMIKCPVCKAAGLIPKGKL